MPAPNVLLVVLDTARASRVYDETVMPNVTQLAGGAATYTNAYATAPWSLPSHASLFTGARTSTHGVHADAPQFAPDRQPLAARFQAAGYRTLAYSNNFWISPSFGFDAGFDEFEVGWELFSGGQGFAEVGKEETSLRGQLRKFAPKLLSRDAPKTLANLLFLTTVWDRHDSGAYLTTRRAKRWLNGDEPFFMFLNYREPHLTYDPPAEYISKVTPAGETPPDAGSVNQDPWAYVTGEVGMDETDFDRLGTLYDAELRYLDARLGQLFEALDTQDLLDETLIIVTSDHGENIGDHGLMDHQYCLYDTLLHVPLVVRGPGVEPGCRDGLVELRDLYQTLLAAAGIEGADPAVDLRNRPGRDAIAAEYRTPMPSIDRLQAEYGDLPESVQTYDRGLQAIRTEDWKLIRGTDGSERLYDLAADPNEYVDRSDAATGVRDRLADQLSDRLPPLERPDTAAETESAVPATLEDRLEDLGYLQ